MTQGIRNKYFLIKYYYTQMFLGSVYGAGPMYNPMFFHFPDDMNAYLGATSNSVMLGGALKLSIAADTLNRNITNFYFPTGIWCNLMSQTEPEDLCFESTGGTSSNKNLASKLYDYNVHLYQGFIVPL
jgi:alpha-glucosidase (family GH31 glycosyl hydrolase)